MDINESSRIYLENYYVLEQTRNETNHFLENIAIRFSTLVEDEIRHENTDEISFRKYVQKDGGYVEFIFDNKKSIRHLESFDRWKYKIIYEDAMRKENLSSSTSCRVYGYSPQIYRQQISELKRMAKIMKLPDPYGSNEIDLLKAPVDEIVGELKNIFMDYHSNFLKIIEALIEEGRSR